MVVTVEELSDAERRVWNAFPAGTLVNFLTGSAENDDPAGGEHWGEDRQVRAEVLLALLCGAVEVEPGQVGVVNLQGARITSAIKLLEATFKHALLLDRCYIGDGIVLPEATTRSVALRNCHIGPIGVSNAKINGAFVLTGSHLDGKDGPALVADGLTVTGNMDCGGVTAGGPIRLAYASVRGALGFIGAHLDGKGKKALFAHKLTVTGDMSCDEDDESGGADKRFRADGGISLAGARIDGQLVFNGAHLDGKGKEALFADGLTVTGDMFCGGVTAGGQVSLAGASVRGALWFSSAHLDGKGKKALFAHRLTVTGDMDCGGVTAAGQVSLAYARIGGQLVFSGAHLDGKGKKALFAYKLTVTGDMDCNEDDESDQGDEAEGDEADKRFRADGGINIMGASIGGHLWFSGAHLDGKDGPALIALGLDVTGNMDCDGVTVAGRVYMAGASIGGQLAFSGAHLDGKDGPALVADGLTVTGDMSCDEDDESGGADKRFRADGGISLAYASIGGQLVFSGAHLDGKGKEALFADGLTVTGEMACDQKFRADGGIILAGAKIGQLQDEKESWPKPLELDGLTYGGLADMHVKDRLEWLKLSPYRAQPYEHLAAYYRRQGEDRPARRVLLAKQRARRKQHHPLLRGWGWLQDGLVGYGYAPGRALLLLAVAFAAGWVVFRSHHPPPVNPATHPVFNAALYTLDVLIPAPGLGQASDWDPHGIELAVAAGLHILGWLLAITVIAAITRLFSRS